MCCSVWEVLTAESNLWENTWPLCDLEEGRRNLQSFALQLHVLGKNVITLITFSMCVTPVAVHCANDFNQITCCRDSACRLWGVRKNVNLPLRGFFFLFSSPHPPRLASPWPCMLGCALVLKWHWQPALRVELKFPPGHLNRNSGWCSFSSTAWRRDCEASLLAY